MLKKFLPFVVGAAIGIAFELAAPRFHQVVNKINAERNTYNLEKIVEEYSCKSYSDIYDADQQTKLRYALYKIVKSDFLTENALDRFSEIPIFLRDLNRVKLDKPKSDDKLYETKACYIGGRNPSILHKKGDYVSEEDLIHEFLHHHWYTMLTEEQKKEFSASYSLFLKHNRKSFLCNRISHNPEFEDPVQGYALIGADAYDFFTFIDDKRLTIPLELQEFYKGVIKDSVFPLPLIS